MRQEYIMDFHFDHSPAVLWPLMIETPRSNEATDFPRHEVTQNASAGWPG